MLESIILTTFGTLCALWFLFSALTIFLMVKYNGLSVTVWTIIILYCVITLPIALSGLTGAFNSNIDFEALIPGIFTP